MYEYPFGEDKSEDMATFDTPFLQLKISKGPPRFLYEAVRILCMNRSHNPNYLRFGGNLCFH